MKRIFALIAGILLGVNSLQALDSLHIRSVGADQAWEQARCIAVNRGFAFIGTTGNKLHVVNLARPDHPIEMARFNLPGVVGIDFLPGFALAATGENGWAVLNIATPQDPFVLARVRGDNVNAVVARNGFALIGTESGALISYDMSNPGIPEERSRVERLSAVRRIVLRDRIAFVATLNGLVTVDIRDLASIEFLSRLTVRGGHTDLTIDGNLAYMLDSPDTIRIIDIADPADMDIIWNHQLFHPADRMLIEGRYIYLSQPGLNGFNILDRWDLDTPDTVGFFPSCWGAAGMLVLDGNLWTVGKGVTSFSLIDPAEPSQVGHLGYCDNIVEIAVDGGRAYLVGENGGILEADITDLTAPAVRNGTGYGADCWGASPEFRNISDLFALVCGESEISTLRRYENRIEAWASYVAEGDEALSDAANDNGRLDVAAGAGGWLTFNYNAAEFNGELELLNRTATNWPAKSITSFIWPGLAIACRNERGDSVEVISYLGERSTYLARTPQGGRTILRSSESVMLLAASNFYTLSLIDDEQLQRVGRYAPVAPIEDISVEGTFAAVLEGTRKVSIVNFAIPTNPYQTGYYVASGDINSVELRGDYLYIGGSTEFRILDVTNCLNVPPSIEPFPTELSLTVFPNPFNSSTTISFSLPVSGWTSLDVVDVSGRLVTRLSDGWREAGSYRELLNGEGLTNGEYFIRLSKSGQIIAQQIVLVK